MTNKQSRRTKPVEWVGSSLADLRSFPIEVRRDVGQAIYEAQIGGKHPAAKPLSGFGGAGVLEIVARHEGNAFRAVYTLRFTEAVYVLHAFQKKSQRGIKTPKSEMDMVKHRMRMAEEHYRIAYPVRRSEDR